MSTEKMPSSDQGFGEKPIIIIKERGYFKPGCGKMCDSCWRQDKVMRTLLLEGRCKQCPHCYLERKISFFLNRPSEKGDWKEYCDKYSSPY